MVVAPNRVVAQLFGFLGYVYELFWTDERNRVDEALGSGGQLDTEFHECLSVPLPFLGGAAVRPDICVKAG